MDLSSASRWPVDVLHGADREGCEAFEPFLQTQCRHQRPGLHVRRQQPALWT